MRFYTKVLTASALMLLLTHLTTAIQAQEGGAPASRSWYVRDCICNSTTKTLRVWTTSGYKNPGYNMTVLKPGECVRWYFVNDGKVRVLSAFTLDNELVATFTFEPLNVPPAGCLQITEGASQVKRAVKGASEESFEEPEPSGT